MLAEKVKPSIRLQNSSRFHVRQRYPTNAHWDALVKLQSNLLEPEVFIQRWQVSQQNLARICSCSKRTVERWFSQSDYHPPSFYHRFCLGLVDKLWSDLSVHRGNS